MRGWKNGSRSKISRWTWTTAAKKLLAKEGYDPQFGARPLKRAVQEQLLNPLSMKLLEGEFKPGDRIKVTASDEGLVFNVK